ncbi:amino acid adenylation domain-containing protein, partial [Motilimonas pumila]
DATALIFKDKQLSYGELNSKANQLAHYLLTEKQITPDTLVGICIERSLEMVIAILGVLKAGGAYVPLDPDYPEARLTYMLEDAGLVTVITQAELLKSTPVSETQALCLDGEFIQQQLDQQPTINPEKERLGLNSNHLAYVIYTSGSTGNPKGVMVEHSGLLNLVYAQRQGFNVTQSCQVLQFASVAFDAAISEIAVTLCTGAQLVLVSGETAKTVALLEEVVKKSNITHATLPPALLSTLDLFLWKHVSTLIIAGEACSVKMAEVWSDNRVLINAYGPTESTVCASMGVYKQGGGYLHMGKPLQNIQSYILNKNNKVVAIGCEGELHIGGAGLARGYLNRPDLTAQMFIDNPFYDKSNPDSSERLYKTGDLV